MDDAGGGYLPLVMLPRRASRSACAPNETLRENGELGGGEELSFSSVTASSVFPVFDPKEPDRLPRRKGRDPNGEGCVGEPESPRVVMDSLRWGLD